LIRAASAQWSDAIGSTARPLVKRKGRVRHLTDSVIIAIILAATALCIEFYLRSRSELELALTRHQAATERVNGLNIKVEQLERDVKALRNDSRVIEQFARQKFGFVREGDLVVRIKEDPDRPGDPPLDSRQTSARARALEAGSASTTERN